MTIIEKVLEDNKDCNIFRVMDENCPSDYGYNDICECRMTCDAAGQVECLMCWTRWIKA